VIDQQEFTATCCEKDICEKLRDCSTKSGNKEENSWSTSKFVEKMVENSFLSLVQSHDHRSGTVAEETFSL